MNGSHKILSTVRFDGNPDDRSMSLFPFAGIIAILDTMLILKINDISHQPASSHTPHDDHYSETSLTGLNILLILLAHPNVIFCAQAANRIQLILNDRPLSGREEAAYLLSKINQVFSSVLDIDQLEHNAHLLSLMRIILEKAFDFLPLNVSMLSIPLYPEVLTTVDEFREYMSAVNRADWQRFIQQVTEPYADHYCSMSVRPFEMNMKIWWNDCQEMINIGIHKRNRQIGVEKLKFQVRDMALSIYKPLSLFGLDTHRRSLA
jgi:hypothetical protein